MKSMKLDVTELTVSTRKGLPLISNISFSLEEGQVVGLTGESGSGKSTLIRSILGIYSIGIMITKGNIILGEKNLLHLPMKAHRNLCGTQIGYIPQNPIGALNPTRKIGSQMSETFQLRLGFGREESNYLARQMLEIVQLLPIDRIFSSYPNQLSGGMLQRICIAILLGLRPKFILADEPTSALDLENRNIVLEVFKHLRQDTGILFVTHDLSALKEIADETIIMHQGELIKQSVGKPNLEKVKEIVPQHWIISEEEAGKVGWEWMDCE